MLINLADPGSPEAITVDDFLSLMIDRRDFHVPTVEKIVNGKKKRVAYEPEERDWNEVRGITLHQTACDMGERIERYDSIGAHYSILRSGRILRHCDNNRVVYHGNGWNNQCVGIEVNGRYAGREDDPDTALDEALKTTWDDPTTPTRELPMIVTPQSMVSLRMLIRWIAYDVLTHGGHLKILGAHRQASPSRRNDPGEAIWKQGAVPMHAELGLSDGGKGFVIPGSGGYPIPECWDERYTGIAY